MSSVQTRTESKSFDELNTDDLDYPLPETELRGECKELLKDLAKRARELAIKHQEVRKKIHSSTATTQQFEFVRQIGNSF